MVNGAGLTLGPGGSDNGVLSIKGDPCSSRAEVKMKIAIDARWRRTDADILTMTA